MDSNTTRIMFSSMSTEYQTPDEIFKPVQKRLLLTKDIAASEDNHRLPTYCTPDGTYVKNFSTAYRKSELHGLSRESWEGQRVWCNPPYSRSIEAWVQAAALWKPEVAVLLLPARTETDWFQRWVAPYAEVHFIMGRIRFWGHSKGCFVWDEDGNNMGWHPVHGEHPNHQLDAAPFPSVLAVYQTGIWVPRGRINAFTWDPRTDEGWDGGIHA